MDRMEPLILGLPKSSTDRKYLECRMLNLKCGLLFATYMHDRSSKYEWIRHQVHKDFKNLWELKRIVNNFLKFAPDVSTKANPVVPLWANFTGCTKIPVRYKMLVIFYVRQILSWFLRPSRGVLLDLEYENHCIFTKTLYLRPMWKREFISALSNYLQSSQ
jgi:hypothetical protein